MTNEEINVLINIHIKELEQLEQNGKTKRLIEALRIASEIIEDNGKGIYKRKEMANKWYWK